MLYIWYVWVLQHCGWLTASNFRSWMSSRGVDVFDDHYQQVILTGNFHDWNCNGITVWINLDLCQIRRQFYWFTSHKNISISASLIMKKHYSIWQTAQKASQCNCMRVNLLVQYKLEVTTGLKQPARIIPFSAQQPFELRDSVCLMGDLRSNIIRLYRCRNGCTSPTLRRLVWCPTFIIPPK
jgi:hypothetical protein